MEKVGTAVWGLLCSSRACKEGRTKVDMLLHCAGPEAQDVHNNFMFSDTDGDSASDYITVCSRSSKSIASRGKIRFSSRICFGSLSNMKVESDFYACPSEFHQ